MRGHLPLQENMAALTKRRNVASLDNVSRLCYYCLKRSISSKKFYSSDATIPPLNIALPGVYSDNLKNGNMSKKGVTACTDVQITTLSNGVKVASEESFGPFCTLGGFCIFLLLESYVIGFTIWNPTLPPRLQTTYVHKPTLQPVWEDCALHMSFAHPRAWWTVLLAWKI